MSFNMKKNGTTAMISTGEVIVGSLGANVIQNVLPPQFKKFAGLGALVGGVVAQMFDDSHIKSIGLGLAGMGTVNALKEFLGDKVPQLAIALSPNSSSGVSGFELGMVEEPTMLLGYDDDIETSVDLSGMGDEFEDYDSDILDGFEDEYTDYELAGVDEESALATL